MEHTESMVRTDALVLGAGIVGTSVALHLAKRGLSVALVDRRGPGEETSYGNAGVIEGNTIFPPVFPTRLRTLLQVALKRATDADYHLSSLLRIAPWLLQFRAHSRPERLLGTVNAMRPLFAQAAAEHTALATESGAQDYFHQEGWLKIYRSKSSFDAVAPELALAAELNLPNRVLDRDQALALEPHLAPVFEHAVHWSGATSISNPLALTRAYAARFISVRGLLLNGDARSLHRSDSRWQVDTAEGPVESDNVVVALGPWAADLLRPLGIKLPLGIKRGYHRHFRPRGNAGLNRPVLDAEYGYMVAPMEQGLRLTTGAEFAARDAPPSPAQLTRLMPAARTLFPLGEPVEAQPWMGCRPCFPDSRPVIGRAPGQSGLWLAIGHAHWGLTLGPATGRMIAEMMTGAAPFCDPAPYGAERFLR
jgi:D-amino-acid dehydrogenase